MNGGISSINLIQIIGDINCKLNFLFLFSTDAKSSEDQKVLTLAEQFIAAMPARIKNESEIEPMHLDGSSPVPFDASQSDDLGIESMADELDLEFDFSLDETYRLIINHVLLPSSFQ